MQLGAFSISLAVKDLEASKSFYEKLGFRQTGGDGTGYLMMASGTTIIGLFHGMFEGNILTFNPGLAQDMSRVEDFTDVREIRASLVAEGVEMSTDTDPEGTGSAHIVVVDPDGNPVLVDQFFPKPGSEADEGCPDQNPGRDS
jgi:catechol 2,3-dioxygenase-like lactoylglutathione lyase family enzyme